MLKFKSHRFFVFIPLFLFLFACGGGGGDSGSGSAPGISNLSFSPSSAQVGDGGGAITVTGSFDFVDPDGDVVAGRTIGKECGVGPDIINDFTVTGASGITADTLLFVSAFSTNCPAGTYTGQVFLIDSQGNESNRLTGTFTLF